MKELIRSDEKLGGLCGTQKWRSSYTYAQVSRKNHGNAACSIFLCRGRNIFHTLFSDLIFVDEVNKTSSNSVNRRLFEVRA